MDNYKPDIILVGFEPSNGEDTCVLIVGRKRMNESVEIINAFQGEEALELYKQLVTVKSKEERYDNN